MQDLANPFEARHPVALAGRGVVVLVGPGTYRSASRLWLLHLNQAYRDMTLC